MQKFQKALILCLLFFCSGVFASAQTNSSQTSVSGTVLEQGTNVPVEFAVVVLSPAEIYTTTDKNGNFEFKKVDPGKSTIKIQFVGMETIERDVTIIAGKENVFDFKMNEANFHLEDVVVIAQQSKAGQSTASNISRQAMDHLQASSLGDVMQLLPGVAISNPSLSSASHITIRHGSTLGTAIVVDGAPVSANSNMQALAPTISGGTDGTQSGVDVRGISTDNIESIEIIRGVPSVEYGDLTAGAVIIKSKAGKEPLSVRVKANPLSYQGAASKGFALGKKGGFLNLTGDYAYNTSKLTEGYAYFQRFNVKGLWSKKFSDVLNTNTSLDFGFRKDTRELNPDDQRNQYEASGSDKSVRFNTNGTININKGWFKTIKYTVSANYSDKYNYEKELLTNAEALHTTCLVDGAILSNTGLDVYDIDGNKITNIPDNNSRVKVLPYTYVSIYEILGKELNGYAQLKLDFNKRWGNANNHILIGADYKTDGNLGEGKVYDEELPPMRSASSDYASYRRRPYYDVPFLHQIGVFAEDTYKQFFGERELNLKVGGRFDWINGKTAISPRVNVSMDIIPNVFVIRGGWGVNAKAPTALLLYPENAYFNYNNYFYEGESGTTQVSTNRVFETKNKDLEIAKLRRAEVGFDLKLFDRYSLSVTAYDDLMKNGYGYGKDINTFMLVPFTRYQAVLGADGNYVPQLEGTYNIFSSFSMPMNKGYSHNRGIEFELDLGRFDDIRTSFFLNGAYTQTMSTNTNPSFGTNKNGSKLEKNIAVYDAGLEKDYQDILRTILRITHNIPELGFVVTLATQVNWINKQWTVYGNNNDGSDEVFTQYISYKDGKVYPFDASKKNDPEFAYMFDSFTDSRFIAESYFPTVTFNLNISKEIGDILTASFFVNNMFNSRPLYELKKNPGSFSELGSKIFFGFDLKVNIK